MPAYKRRRKPNNRIAVLALILVVLLVILTLLLTASNGMLQDLVASLGIGETKPTSSTTQVSETNASTTTPTIEPTPEPTPSPKPTPTPEVIDPAQILLAWDEVPSFKAKTALGDGGNRKTFSDGSRVDYWALVNGKIVKSYKAPYPVAFASAESFSEVGGVLAFRGNHMRNAPSYGTREVVDRKLEIIWEYGIGAISGAGSYWPGTGWTGQPLLVHWPEETKNAMNIIPEMKAKDLVEVVYPTLDGNIYFLDLETGIPTREKIVLGHSFKGTGAIDPRGYPILYAGQGLNDNSGKKTPFKYRMYNLLDQTELFTIPGADGLAFRQWGAFDSSGLLNRQTDTFIECAENGLVYKVKLNSAFDAAAKTLTVDPEITRYRYKTSYSSAYGIEASPAFYRNLMFIADNGGVVQCVDINTMEPVWIFATGDDTDCTMTVDEEDDGVFVYTANEIDKRGKNTNSNIRKINAFTGELVWQVDVPCIYQSYINGGALATPLIGKNDIDDLVIFNIGLTGGANMGKLIAIDKKSGNIVWERDMDSYSWSSPVDFQADDGKTWAVVCDFAGHMHLFDPRTGADADMISLGQNVESSPAMYNDTLVVGSYERKIFGIKVR